jgi:hypothetical protein
VTFPLTEQKQCSSDDTLKILWYSQRQQTTAAFILRACDNGQSMEEHSKRGIKLKKNDLKSENKTIFLDR